MNSAALTQRVNCATGIYYSRWQLRLTCRPALTALLAVHLCTGKHAAFRRPPLDKGTTGTEAWENTGLYLYHPHTNWDNISSVEHGQDTPTVKHVVLWTLLEMVPVLIAHSHYLHCPNSLISFSYATVHLFIPIQVSCFPHYLPCCRQQPCLSQAILSLISSSSGPSEGGEGRGEGILTFEQEKGRRGRRGGGRGRDCPTACFVPSEEQN